MDSLKILPASLKVLVENLKQKDSSAFINTRKLCNSENTFELLTQKQPYPYAYPTILSDYNYVRLPNKKYFRNELKGGQNISDDDYQHAKKIYEQFGCKTFLDFHKLYLSSDVTLLADVFEMHRKFCQELFQLDVSKY